MSLTQIKTLSICFLLLSWLITRPAMAWDETITEKIKSKFPNSRVSSVRPGPFLGLYEVVLGKNIIYVDSSLQYALFGGIIDTTTGVNVTDARMQEINKIDPSEFPLHHAITFGTGRKHLYIFSDPDCPFCQKLHPELAKLNDVTIHLFLYPIKELHPNAYYKAVAIWCSKDKKAALDAVFSGKQVEDHICEHPISENIELGKSLQISGTPTLFFEDGTMAVGYQKSDMIQARIDGKKLIPSGEVTEPASAEKRE